MRNRTARRARPTNLSNRGIGTLPWSYFVVIAICGCVIAAGFLLAARQHFVSMDLGMKNSRLRKQLDDLESENRRLTLAREIALSPIEITKTARNLGFVETADVTMPVPAVAPGTSSKSENGVLIKAVQKTPGAVSPASVVKTAFQRPVNMDTKGDTAKKPAPEKVGKKGETAKVKTAKPTSNSIARN